MKRDDIVTVNDFSWFSTLGTNTYDYVKDCNKRYKILDTECYFPLEGSQSEKYRNDTTIQAIYGGEVLVIHGAFLRPVPPTHKVMINVTTSGGCFMYGEIVEISDKLYQEIKHGA